MSNNLHLRVFSRFLSIFSKGIERERKRKIYNEKRQEREKEQGSRGIITLKIRGKRQRETEKQKVCRKIIRKTEEEEPSFGERYFPNSSYGNFLTRRSFCSAGSVSFTFGSIQFCIRSTHRYPPHVQITREYPCLLYRTPSLGLQMH